MMLLGWRSQSGFVDGHALIASSDVAGLVGGLGLAGTEVGRASSAGGHQQVQRREQGSQVNQDHAAQLN